MQFASQDQTSHFIPQEFRARFISPSTIQKLTQTLKPFSQIKVSQVDGKVTICAGSEEELVTCVLDLYAVLSEHQLLEFLVLETI